MSAERRIYRRESEETRREALIQATLDLVAEGGGQAATVRAIAGRAGVTAGLIYLLHAKRTPYPLLDPALFRYPLFRAAATGGSRGHRHQTQDQDSGDDTDQDSQDHGCLTCSCRSARGCR